MHCLNGECICHESPARGEICPHRGEQFSCPWYNTTGTGDGKDRHDKA